MGELRGITARPALEGTQLTQSVTSATICIDYRCPDVSTLPERLQCSIHPRPWVLGGQKSAPR
jgi:hypothetical protein